VLFALAAAGDVAPHHLAFRVPGAAFPRVVERLGRAGSAYGNDPEHPDNGRTDDPLGGPGRVYFVRPDGHLFEVTVTA
jgi:catechol 2,3-dioxygenase-like lactoylglutathione lyase family enzyme